jgi:hypothetical protein
MWRFHSPRPISILEGLWAALWAGVIHALVRRRIPAALLTGALVAVWPKIEAVLMAWPQYHRLMMLRHRLLEPVYRFRAERVQGGFGGEQAPTHDELVERLGFDPESGPPPELETLRAVVPVAQSHRTEDGTLMLLSIDSYEEGFEGRTRFFLDREPEVDVDAFGPRDMPAIPEFALSARDDRGQAYPIVPHSGGGGGRRWESDFRSFVPLDPRARELTLEVPEIRWTKPDRRHRTEAVERVQRGPWAFTVAL